MWRTALIMDSPARAAAVQRNQDREWLLLISSCLRELGAEWRKSVDVCAEAAKDSSLPSVYTNTAIEHLFYEEACEALAERFEISAACGSIGAA